MANRGVFRTSLLEPVAASLHHIPWPRNEGLGLTGASAAALNRSLPFRIVDVAEHLRTHAFVQLGRALWTAIELVAGSVRKNLSVP
jgi:hypothetical protein